MATRLKDIAYDLGLSVVTISKVLRNHPDISERTRKRVLKRMKELTFGFRQVEAAIARCGEAQEVGF
jgi:DNA-binding LacI/PurR family transcriptional regulator